ncbi:Carnitine O-acetyltransferase, mitochondrial, partial [Smittium mucronatum]
LDRAISAQSQYTRAAASGRGVDRLFLGLKYSIKPGEEWPELFTDPSFKKSSYWQLSTSQISEEFMDAYGWGQVVYDGFGIAYMVLNDTYHFNVASTHLGSQRLCDAIAQSMNDIYNVLVAARQNPEPSVSAPVPTLAPAAPSVPVSTITTAESIQNTVVSALKSVTSSLSILSMTPSKDPIASENS